MNVEHRMKNKMKINVIAMPIVIVCVLLLQSCAPTRPTKLTAIASTDQKIGFEETILSSKKHSVSLSPYEELDVAADKTLFMLDVQNNGDTSFDIGYNDITVDFQDSDMTLPASRMQIQSYEDFMDDLMEEQSRREREHIRDGLKDVLSEYVGSSSSGASIASSGQASGSGGSDQSSYSGSSGQASGGGSSGEPPLTLLIELIDSAKVMRDNDRMLREAMPIIVMTPHTVMPGGAYSGIVVCDTRDLDEKMEGRFQVAVLVGGEEHVFTFDRVLNK